MKAAFRLLALMIEAGSNTCIERTTDLGQLRVQVYFRPIAYNSIDNTALLAKIVAANPIQELPDMIIHAPHQFPEGICYSIYCSQPLSSKAGLPKANKNISSGFIPGRVQAVKNFLAKVARRLKLKRLKDKIYTPSSGAIEKKLALKLRNILARFCPGSQFTGFQRDFMRKSETHAIVVFSWNWHSVKSELLAHGWPQDSILIMPVPESDPWAYWNNAHFILADNDGNVDFAGTMKNPDFVEHLMVCSVLLRGKGQREYRNYTDRSPLGMLRESHVYPFPSFATDVVAKNLEKINRVKDALSDDDSRKIYTAVLFGTPDDRFRHYFSNTLVNMQYFEYISIKPGDCIVNAGVADGSTEIPFFCAHMETEGKVYCLDPGGFDDLSPYASHFYHAHRRLLSVHKYVVCDRSAGVCPQPRIGDFSGCVPVTIDDFVEQQHMSRVDLIKTDIEGMESTALEKMAKTVARFRPQLAISVYHETEHFWELPLQIMDMCKDYDFHFNIYSPTHFEGIFYAIPKEKKRQSVRPD